jgi:hypothetical protein
MKDQGHSRRQTLREITCSTGHRTGTTDCGVGAGTRRGRDTNESRTKGDRVRH